MSRDRLALKLYLLENGKSFVFVWFEAKFVFDYLDDAETIQELDNMFHDVDKAFVEEQIVK